MRWCIVQEYSGDYFLCPLEKKDEALAAFDKALEEPYICDYPDYLISLHTQKTLDNLTFESPEFTE